MITSAAVKIYDYIQSKEIIIPCHRHGHAFQILHDLGYRKDNYKELEQGFLDEHGAFYSRCAAYKEAVRCKQFIIVGATSAELYSEDLW